MKTNPEPAGGGTQLPTAMERGAGRRGWASPGRPAEPCRAAWPFQARPSRKSFGTHNATVGSTAQRGGSRGAAPLPPCGAGAGIARAHDRGGQHCAPEPAPRGSGGPCKHFFTLVILSRSEFTELGIRGVMARTPMP